VRKNVQYDENYSGKIGWKERNQVPQGFNAARRSADDDNVAAPSARSNPCSSARLSGHMRRYRR